ncbi:TetR/AcrR family transcriptional regulator [Kribbella sp. CA-247076]|uniref:TetR/AcrR family transcriptional regulator n=1 Tax=Kribbella sp. CA-247076 TaxID=3239941 RepID=UPI003D8E23CC
MSPRADAVRNRQKILDAAREQITRSGPEAGMDEIAAAAGVAVGTLYRHFPNKTDLVTAVIAEYLGHVADDAEAANARLAAGATAIDEITSFVERVLETSAVDHAVKAAARALGAATVDEAAESRARAAVEPLIAAAQKDGDLHPDVTVDDFYLLISSAPIDQPPEARARWLTLVFRGLVGPESLKRSENIGKRRPPSR